jgi:hypothetical protein
MTDKHDRPIFIIALQSPPHVDVMKALRSALKLLLRCGLKIAAC